MEQGEPSNVFNAASEAYDWDIGCFISWGAECDYEKDGEVESREGEREEIRVLEGEKMEVAYEGGIERVIDSKDL